MKCPVCGSAQTIRKIDSGLKRIWRAVIRNPRWFCEKCRITWRAERPEQWLEIEP